MSRGIRPPAACARHETRAGYAATGSSVARSVMIRDHSVRPVRIRTLVSFALLVGALQLALGAVGCAAIFVRGDGVSEEERQQIAEETAPYLEKGTGVISGVVRVQTDYGVFVASRGTQVALTPATTIASERFQKHVVEDNELPAQRKAELVLFTRTDAAGRFHFDRLPPGEYLIVSPVRWSPTGKGEDAHTEVPYARVTLGDGVRAEVVVTREIDDD